MIETARLRLRPWRANDAEPFQKICSDVEVMATLGPSLDMAATRALIVRMQGLQDTLGHCFWAMERIGDERLIGWCGAIRGSVGPVVDRIEIGWRMARDCWGSGYATEAAAATIDWCFANRADDAVWAITNIYNQRSRAVMERLGMRHREDLDFDHPKLTKDDPLLRHVAYALSREDHAARRNAA
jgi:RimJ/RimL family protein N-acetyltransferase